MKKVKNKIKKENQVKNNKSKTSIIAKKIGSLKNKFKKKTSIFRVNKDVTYTFKEVIIIMFFSLGLGFFACISFMRVFSHGRDYKALSKDLSKLVDTYYAIKDNYYGELDTDLLVDSAIEGMIGAVGDIYTSYSDSDSADNFMQTVSGIYEGIGCTVSMNLDNQIVVVDMFDNSPSKKAGVEVGDVILKIDDIDYSNKNSNDMSNYVRNSKKEEVKLTILRDNEEKEIVIKREKIEIPYVDSEIIESNGEKIGYINVALFSSVVNIQFKNALEKLEKEGIDSLIIDVRGNSGGYLSSVTDVINMFLKKGDIIYRLEDNSGTVVKKDTTKEERKYPLAILVNGGSASAAEILASAIKESYGGFIVGTNTYGKGTVQQTTTLPDGSMVKYTTQNWLTPDGNWINDVGLEPTDIVELDEAFLENPIRENDNQLNKAIELLINKDTSN